MWKTGTVLQYPLFNLEEYYTIHPCTIHGMMDSVYCVLVILTVRLRLIDANRYCHRILNYLNSTSNNGTIVNVGEGGGIGHKYTFIAPTVIFALMLKRNLRCIHYYLPSTPSFHETHLLGEHPFVFG